MADADVTSADGVDGNRGSMVVKAMGKSRREKDDYDDDDDDDEG